MKSTVTRQDLMKAFQLDNAPAVLLRAAIQEYCDMNTCSTDVALAQIDISGNDEGGMCGRWGGVNVFHDSSGAETVEYTTSRESSWMHVGDIVEQALSPCPNAPPSWWDDDWTYDVEGKTGTQRDVEREQREHKERWGE